MKRFLLVSILLSSSLSGCFGDEGAAQEDLEAVFTFSPLDNIREGQTVNFDGSQSVPSTGSITYKWDFETDGSVDKTGKTSTWVYATQGTYNVTLTISDGMGSDSQTRQITVFAATAVAPTADAGSFSSDDDCLGDTPPDGSYYLFYICELDKDATNSGERKASATTTAALDASDSYSGSEDDYIAKWNWDTNLLVDSDGDGDLKNDADLQGETVDWMELSPGEYKIQLTVINGEGLSDTDAITVYVNYVATWTEFLMDANSTQEQGPKDLDFDFSSIYNSDSGNTIRKAQVELIYPQQDDDCFGGETYCRNKLDLYAFNESNKDSKEEDAQNTSDTALENRQAGNDCPSDSDCVWLSLTGWSFSDDQHKDGDWIFSIRNEEFRDIEVETLTLKLVYK